MFEDVDVGGTTGVSGQDCDRREFSVLRSFVSDKEDFVSPGGGVFCVFLVGFVFFLLIPVTADMFDLILRQNRFGRKRVWTAQAWTDCISSPPEELLFALFWHLFEVRSERLLG